MTGGKAPVDAYRVAMGAEQEKDTEIDPMREMMFCKVIELCAESIPAIVAYQLGQAKGAGIEKIDDVIDFLRI